MALSRRGPVYGLLLRLVLQFDIVKLLSAADKDGHDLPENAHKYMRVSMGRLQPLRLHECLRSSKRDPVTCSKTFLNFT